MEINEHQAETPAAQADRGVRADVPQGSKTPTRWHRIGALGWSRSTPADPVQPSSRTPHRAVQRQATRRPSKGEFVAVAALGLLLAGLIAVAFRGSWTAHRDAALSAHFDMVGADLYPFAPDGLIIIALIAAMVLRHSRGARFYSLAVVALFTGTSYVINHLHGLGWFAMRPGTLDLVTPLPWGVVALVALQVIGAIFFGSHILVHVFRHLFPGVSADQPTAADPATKTESTDALTGIEVGQDRSAGDVGAHPDAGVQRTAEEELAERKKWAAVAYGIALDKGVTISKAALAEAFQISARQAGYVRSDVDLAREERSEIDVETEHPRATSLTPMAAVERPSPNGSHPVSA